MKQRKISFYSEGCKLDGTIYLPDDYKEGEKRPCIIPNSGFMGLNVVYPALFSRSFTKEGYVCMGFDYRGWPPSEGKLGYCTMDMEVEDICNAITYAKLQPETDPEKMGLLGWGQGAPMVIKVAAENPEIKCVAALGGFYNGERLLKTIQSYTDWLKTKEKIEEDRNRRVLENVESYEDLNKLWHYDYTARDEYLQGTLSEKLDDGLQKHLKKYYPEGFPPKAAWAVVESIVKFNAEKYVAEISPRPVFIGHPTLDLAYPPDEAKSVYEKALEPKTLHWMEGTHNGFMFDNDPVFKRMIAELVKFFDSTLKK